MVHKDVTGCHPYVYQAEPLRKLEMGLTPVLVFQVSKIRLVPSLPRTSSPEESSIGTQSFCLDAVLRMTVVISSYVSRSRPRSLNSRGRATLLTSMKRIPSQDQWDGSSWFTCARGGPISFMLGETDPYVSYPAKRTPLSPMIYEADTYATLVAPFDFSYYRDPDFLMEGVVCPSHSSLMT